MVNGTTSSATSYAPENTPTTAVQQMQPSSGTQNTIQTAPSANDSVQLSAAAQAHAMQQQGMNVKTIAANMGITTQDVDSYLGISSATSGGGGGGLSTLQDVAANVRVNGPSGSTVS